MPIFRKEGDCNNMWKANNSILLSLMTLSMLVKSIQCFTGLSSSAPRGLRSAAADVMTPSFLQSVSRKESYSVTLLPGDGIGPEISEAAKVAIQALCNRCNFQIHFKEALIGGAAIDAVQDPFPAETLAQCLASDSVLLACIGGYKWDTNPRELRPETGLLRMRSTMKLFANLRPAKVLKQLIDASTLKPEVIEGVDIMVVRELTGDVYFGSPKGIDTNEKGT
jgi:3-isopropylmalate dehydrogenase